jgi:hypothetical protein
MTQLRITVGSYEFVARMEEDAAPKTCAAFVKLLPFHHKIIQARWSGEAAWIPLLQYPQTDRGKNSKFVPLTALPDICDNTRSITEMSSDFASGEFQGGVGFENHTSHPAPGEILFYPGGFSEPEILFPYGNTLFASKMGQLAGNHFLTIINGNEQLKALGHTILGQGAQDITFILDN